MTYSPPPPNTQQYLTSPAPAAPPLIRRAVAWGAIILAVAFFVGSTIYHYRRSAAAGPATSSVKEMQLTIGAKATVGLQSLATSLPGATRQQIQPMMVQLDALATTPTEKLRIAIVDGEITGGKSALNRITALQPKLAGDDLPEDANILRTIYSEGVGKLDAGQRARLVDRHDWFGHLALAYEQPSDNPDRSLVLAAARKVFIIEITAVVGIGAGILVGLVLLILAIVMFTHHRLLPAYQPRPEYSVYFLEAFAVYLGGFLLISLIAKWLVPGLSSHMWIYYLLLLLPPTAAVLWPLFNGVPSETWRQGLGWHAGRGAAREIALGLVGYIAGLPIIAAAIFFAISLTNAVGAQPTHPIVQELTGSRAQLFGVFLLACVYAPLVEETMFRGAFFHYLRGRHTWILSASVTGLIFAAIHPQGWTMIPALFGIAIVLAAIREWRGTILASAAAHALNNGIVLLLGATLMRS